MGLLDEIKEQPETLARLIDRDPGVFRQAASLAKSSSHVVIAARGTSDNAARYAQYVWGQRNRLSVSLATPSLFSIYESPPRLDGALVVGISQSGESPDIVSVLTAAGEQGRPRLAITNEPSSPLAAAADLIIRLDAGPETAVAATKTYTAELITIAAISEAMTGEDSGLGEVPARVAAVLEDSDAMRATASEFSEFEHAAVLGRGFNLATAFEWALKMQELSYVVAQPFSTADFLHGPIAVVDRGYPVLAVVAEGMAADDVLEALDRSRRRGAPTLTLSNGGRPEGRVLEFPAIPEWLSPIPAIVAAQLFTYWLTVEQGNDPDNPRGLSKVTRTT